MGKDRKNNKPIGGESSRKVKYELDVKDDERSKLERTWGGKRGKKSKEEKEKTVRVDDSKNVGEGQGWREGKRV